MTKLIGSASVMCANLCRLEDDLKALEAAGCDELHFDIMDGLFVPNFTLGFDMIKAVRQATSIPCSAHLMITKPQNYIKRFIDAGCSSVTVHVETTAHGVRLLNQIRDAGASPGIAINPATPLSKLEYLMPFADRVLVMTVDPGYAGQTIIPTAFERVHILHENVQYQELNLKIEVDGNISIQNAALLAEAGADIFVLGTASIFNGSNLKTALPEFWKAVEQERLALREQRQHAKAKGMFQ